MSIESEINRINNNVSDALAATAEMGASVPDNANSNNLGALIRSIPKSAGGGSINVTAKVGQTIVVKEVDADGKPTAWEAAEYQQRTHWSEFGTVTIMQETNIEINPDEGQGMAVVDFALEPNKAYTIKYNGVEYADCVGVDVGGSAAFGNLGVLDESLPFTEHPFILVSAAMDIDGDGNTDYILAVMPLDGSTTVTVSIECEGEIAHKIPKKYVPTLEEMRSETVEILPETTIPIDPDGGENMIPVDFALEAGKPYTIKYNGVEYPDCVGMEMQEGTVFFGNLSAFDEILPATNHPFILASVAMDMDEDSNVDYTVMFMPLDGSETVTLSIIGGEKIHKLEGKYLPEGTPYAEPFDDVIMSEYPTLESGMYFTVPVGEVVEGYVYKVNWGGTIYECVAKKMPDSEATVWCLGNLGKISNTVVDTGEPFLIEIFSPVLTAMYGGVTGAILSGSSPENNEFSVTGYLKVQKINNYCMPDIPKTVVVKVVDVGNQLQAENMTYDELQNMLWNDSPSMMYLWYTPSGFDEIRMFSFNRVVSGNAFLFTRTDFEASGVSYSMMTWNEDDTITYEEKTL